MLHNFSKNVKVVRLKPDGNNYTVAAGTGDTLTSNTLDTLGYDGVAFMYCVGAIVAGGTCATKETFSIDDAATDPYVDIAGSHNNFVAADASKVRITDIFRPTRRYLKAVMTRATSNVTVDGVYALLYRAEDAPVTADTTVAGTVTLNAPATGTA